MSSQCLGVIMDSGSGPATEHVARVLPQAAARGSALPLSRPFRATRGCSTEHLILSQPTWCAQARLTQQAPFAPPDIAAACTTRRTPLPCNQGASRVCAGATDPPRRPQWSLPPQGAAYLTAHAGSGCSAVRTRALWHCAARQCAGWRARCRALQRAAADSLTCYRALPDARQWPTAQRRIGGHTSAALPPFFLASVPARQRAASRAWPRAAPRAGLRHRAAWRLAGALRHSRCTRLQTGGSSTAPRARIAQHQAQRTLPEPVLEAARHLLEVAHAPGAGRLPADGLLAPLVCAAASAPAWSGAVPST
jgi:hypothetical protein